MSGMQWTLSTFQIRHEARSAESTKILHVLLDFSWTSGRKKRVKAKLEPPRNQEPRTQKITKRKVPERGLHGAAKSGSPPPRYSKDEEKKMKLRVTILHPAILSPKPRCKTVPVWCISRPSSTPASRQHSGIVSSTTKKYSAQLDATLHYTIITPGTQ